MEATYYVELRPGSESAERQSLYKSLWSCGVTKGAKTRKGWSLVFYPRRGATVLSQTLREVLIKSPAVSSWSRG